VVREAIREDKTTPDLGGKLGTREVGDWICARLSS
jgi:isocitrate/isopropylmalate dehydrogenase